MSVRKESKKSKGVSHGHGEAPEMAYNAALAACEGAILLLEDSEGVAKSKDASRLPFLLSELAVAYTWRVRCHALRKVKRFSTSVAFGHYEHVAGTLPRPQRSGKILIFGAIARSMCNSKSPARRGISLRCIWVLGRRGLRARTYASRSFSSGNL